MSMVRMYSLLVQKEGWNSMKSINELVLLLQFSWVAGDKKLRGDELGIKH